jgi:(2Fe-2S) ferredoxin/predicted O-methyltransferase YrrM
MEPFRFHVFVCNQQKPEGAPCCSGHGSAQVIDALRREIAAGGLDDEVQVTLCGSVGLCDRGPNVIVYPEGVWYSGVTPGDVAEIVESHFRKGKPVDRLVRGDMALVRAEVIGNRDRMRAALRAKDAAGVLPDDLNARIRGFQESRAILTALELDVFTAAGDGATAAEVAARLQTDARATEMLLHALAAMELLVKQNGSFRNTPLAARYFSAASPDCARTALLHTAHLWHSWSTLTEAVRAGTAVAPEAVAGHDAGWVQTFIAAMHRNAAERAESVVRAVGPVAGHMLDIGGGSGAYAIAFAKANERLAVDLLDRAEVTPIAQSHLREAGMEDRIRLIAGDLRTSLPPESYDMAFLSAICHMLSPGENRTLFKRCHDVLAPGGRIVIQDFILEPDKTAPKSAALFALNMLTGTRGGGTYSASEYAEWLQAAGFERSNHVRLPGPASLMVASRE